VSLFIIKNKIRTTFKKKKKKKRKKKKKNKKRLAGKIGVAETNPKSRATPTSPKRGREATLS